MVFPKARLAVSAILFLSWIGFLAFLVSRTRAPVILSRPQVEVSSLIVLADVSEKDGRPVSTVAVKKVFRALADDDNHLAGTDINIEGLADCAPANGWRGPGAYILPLTKRKADSGFSFEVTPIPISPGYVPRFATLVLTHIGPEKEKVAELVAQLTGEKKSDVKSGILRRNMPWDEAEAFAMKLEAAKATVRKINTETRIYRATADALDQLADIKGPSKK